MDRGRSSPDRKGTSRVSKPATGRMNTQPPGTSRRDAQEQRQGGGGQAPAPDNKNTLYIGIGGGALVFVLILAFMLSSGDSEHKAGIGADTFSSTARFPRRRRPTSGESTASASTSATRP
jgi:hypothetical protein